MTFDSGFKVSKEAGYESTWTLAAMVDRGKAVFEERMLGKREAIYKSS